MDWFLYDNGLRHERLRKFQFKIQALRFELNLRKENWLAISTYRPPLVSPSRFLESLTGLIDFFSCAYENFITICDFNAQPLDSAMKDFVRVNGLINVIKKKYLF